MLMNLVYSFCLTIAYELLGLEESKLSWAYFIKIKPKTEEKILAFGMIKCKE